jgi:predicted helicase
LGLQLLFENFLSWKPIAPRSAKELAETTARLCRLLRDEVTEQLALKSPGLTSLAEDWRKLLFPEANDKTFADGYAQAVTFGLLTARAKNIPLAEGMSKVATELAHTSSLIGTALRLLTDNEENQAALKTALDTLIRVLDAVNWSSISKGNADAWLYFYEDFLAVYDNELRKLTGSYYTPPEVVSAMVSLVDEALRTKFQLHEGLAAPSVTLADPATGTGTFFLGVLDRIVKTVCRDQGEGAVAAAVTAALRRLIAFEMQLGPFAVAQLRILAEVVTLTGKPPKTPPRMFVTNTLSDPEEEAGWIPQMLAPLANQRKDANLVMRKEAITVVIGNPPYKEKAMGMGSWVESGSKNSLVPAPLNAWMPPVEWKVGVHSRHLRNMYVYFWRWATWKVFDHGNGTPGPHDGIVCFITAAAFLGGSGFQKMRAYLRETCEDIWVIDCSPEGHQPEVNTRIFQGVQQPICIVIASRSKAKKANKSATVHFQAVPKGLREDKFAALASVKLGNKNWLDCPSDLRAAFLPKPTGIWSAFPKLEDLFIYNGSGAHLGNFSRYSVFA